MKKGHRGPPAEDALSSRSRARLRFITRLGFFALFVLAPPLDLLRFDLSQGHAWFLGRPWTLGLDPFLSGEASTLNAVINLLARGFLPIFGTVAALLWVAWRYGRLYCGWLCPHFSVVELINGLMRRAWGRPTLWEKRSLPPQLPSGRTVRPNAWWWLPALLAIVGFAFLWAVALLTYLVSPGEVYGALANASLPRAYAMFIAIGTVVFALEFLLARHLFCRFGCAAGLFQSLVWMANDRALLVDFAVERAASCAPCHVACENACPMRLKPRNIKRRMFTCTQCVECVAACEQVQIHNPQGTLLRWTKAGEQAAKTRRGTKG